MPTVREIAEAANVSVSTVSLVLNNKPGVSEELRRLVLETRAQLEGEATRRRAAAPNSTRPASIMVLHPPVPRSSYVFNEVLRGIEMGAEAHQAQLRFVPNIHNAPEQHVAHLYLRDPQLRPDGLILFGARRQEPLIDEAQRLGIPCVVLGRDALAHPVSGIGRDEEQIAYEATRYLIELGHRWIAFVGGLPEYDFTYTRQAGYRRALSEAGLPVTPDMVTMGCGAEAARRLLLSVPNVTALLLLNDTCAAEGLPVLREMGWRIPQDVSVITFDNTDFAQSYDPPLTTVAYQRLEEGQWAVKMVMDQIRQPSLRRSYAIFDAQLIVRASCAAPRPSA
jgi:DNA-binding LacI/PurR family transcriptional regulator